MGRKDGRTWVLFCARLEKLRWHTTYDVQGLSITYQQASSPVGKELLRRIVDRRRVGAILDEVHHAGESLSWGDCLRYIFEGATYRLCLSGTPFRSDNNPIPFVVYDNSGRSLCEFNYGYGDALRDDNVVRYVFFPSYEGKMEWVSSDGEEIAATFNDYLSEQRSSERLRTAIEPSAEWLPQVIRDAHERLSAIRDDLETGDPRAGGLIICMNQMHAQTTADLVKRITGTKPVVVISDMEAEASAEIDRYAKGNTPWIVAVKMVSEGVDIPRLRVGIYATNVTTELFFRQAVGRIVRWQGISENENAYFYIPRDERLVSFARAIRDERDHVLMEGMDYSERGDRELDPNFDPALSLYIPISAMPERHNTIVSDSEITPEELAYAKRIAESIGFGHTPEEILAMAFRAAGVNVPKDKERTASRQDEGSQALFIRRQRLRTECNTLASRLSIATGEEHKAIHSRWVHSHGGMWQKNATIEDLEGKREWLREQIRKLT
jgi:superfamily II DNA or RNA helicase